MRCRDFHPRAQHSMTLEDLLHAGNISSSMPLLRRKKEQSSARLQEPFNWRSSAVPALLLLFSLIFTTSLPRRTPSSTHKRPDTHTHSALFERVRIAFFFPPPGRAVSSCVKHFPMESHTSTANHSCNSTNIHPQFRPELPDPDSVEFKAIVFLEVKSDVVE